MNQHPTGTRQWERWLWFALAAAVALFALLLLPVKAPFLVPGMLALSVVLIVKGHQCDARWQLEEAQYNRLLYFSGFITTMLCALGIVLPLAMN